MKKIFFTIALLVSFVLGTWAIDETVGFTNVSGTTITITTVNEMELLAQKVNNGTNYAGYTFQLGNNITFVGTENNFTSIGTTKGFAGTFDGQGHTISGIKISADGRQALFGTLIGATIRNLTLTNSTIKSTSQNYAAGIAAYIEKGVNTIENCHVTNSVTITAGLTAGGIVGRSQGSSSDVTLQLNIIRCTSAAQVSASDIAGGIIGSCGNGNVNLNCYCNTEITNCLYYGTSLYGTHKGGIVGFITASSVRSTTTLSNNFYLFADANIKGVGRKDKGSNQYDDNYDEISGNGTLRVRVVNEDADINDLGTATYDNGMMKLYDKGINYGSTFFSHILALADDADNTSVLNQYKGMTFDVKLRGRRLYKDGYWNTLCLPFDLNSFTSTIFADNCEVREMDNSNTTYQIQDQEGDHCTGVADGKLYLFFKNTNRIAAGQPFIVKWEKVENYNELDDSYDHYEPVFENVEIEYGEDYDLEIESTDRIVTFRGTYDTFSCDDEVRSILFLGSANTLYYPNGTGNAIVGPFRAYFQLNGVQMADSNGEGDDDYPSGPGDVKAFILNIEEDVTDGITIESSPKERSHSVWFSLDGRKLNGKPTQKSIYVTNGTKRFVYPNY